MALLYAPFDAKEACEAFNRADKVLAGGSGSTAAENAALVEAWGRRTGIDPTDPESMAKVYEAVAAMRKKAFEKKAAAARQAELRKLKSAKKKRRP